jgi:hypothetical protein
LVLLIASEVRHSETISEGIVLKEQIPPEEVRREGLLRAYWIAVCRSRLLTSSREQAS